MHFPRLRVVLTGLTVVACHEYPASPRAWSSADPRLGRSAAPQEAEVSATGEGRYNLSGLIVRFEFAAVAQNNENAKGDFEIFTDEGAGLTISFEAKVTCLAVDPVNHHAWIGGTIKENESTDPDFLTDIHQKGRDIWFRVLDDPAGDRSTFVGFTGSAGFVTSADYCAGQPWPAGNARTWPVVSGGITVRP